MAQAPQNPYTEAGVDTAAGDLAVELMKSAVRRTHGPEVLGGVGGFNGLQHRGLAVGRLQEQGRPVDLDSLRSHLESTLPPASRTEQA